ncbi:type III restriction protein subunit R [Cuniculiplasma divulgatum]|uniref:Type III restriction protein subunit R n=2 Tax=Cuniculiplasma divulgatum TaxID=1673428 RepID=A0A1N5S8A5_9ARCH|nr:type III restriction protein subunit R [Cuniculiplasma divulgatum]
MGSILKSLDMLKKGIYEQLINDLIKNELESMSNHTDFQKSPIDDDDSSKVLTLYLSGLIRETLDNVRSRGHGISEQIDIVNKILDSLGKDENLYPNISDNHEKRIENLLAIFDKKESQSLGCTVDKIERPITSISQSSLFTGASREPSMYSELKKEILSSDRIDILVSFIKWSGIRLIINELREFFEKNGKLRIITTTYMGATDVKSIEELNNLKNKNGESPEIKISYDTKRTRLHAKTYIFYRDTGFSTAYIGSSNLSNVAISSGLEWNVKITEKDMLETMNKVKATFQSYWESHDFESYSNGKRDKLVSAINSERNIGKENPSKFIADIHPFAYQQEILDRLEAERVVHGRYKNLIVAATGTGKTVISALDYKRFRTQNQGKTNRLLFVSHRKEILEQAIDCFRSVLRDQNFGEIGVGDNIPNRLDHLFMSIQMFNSRDMTTRTASDYYDFIIIDEFHHASAPSYQQLLTYYKPKILVGLTATPERMDGQDILKYFENKISAEMRLPEAIDRKLLSPFQYFGITDNIDLKDVKWVRGGYDKDQLSQIYSDGNRSSMERVSNIVDALTKYVDDIKNVRGIGFCVSQLHCKFMTEQFNSYGITSMYIDSNSKNDERKNIKELLERGEIKFVFTVDIYNEGVDIPSINTIMFLRPTESLTIFLQQLGRGLRISEGKDCLTVLDFVGQANKNYNFREKFSAMLSKTHMRLEREITDGFPDVPKGCYIQLERRAQEFILDNIRQAVGSRSKLKSLVSTFTADTGLPLTLKNFIEYYQLDLREIYSKTSFSRLKADSGLAPDFNSDMETLMTKAFLKLCSIDSRRWINFLLNVLKSNNLPDVSKMSQTERRMLNMFQYTVWKKSFDQCGFKSPEEAINRIKSSGPFLDEIIELLELRLDKIDFLDSPVNVGFDCPLDLHCNYTRDQILVAMDIDSPENMREGVKYIPKWKIDLLFVTLNKKEGDYTPTTLYEDYSINDTLFHWQSQSTTSVDSKTGKRYINHKEYGSKVLLFVRENKEDKTGAFPYTFLGTVEYYSHEGSRPMNIIWKLKNPIPGKYLEVSNSLLSS